MKPEGAIGAARIVALDPLDFWRALFAVGARGVFTHLKAAAKFNLLVPIKSIIAVTQFS